MRTISLIGAFAFVTLSPAARAVDPPPDGGYPNENTAEGEDALFSLTTGLDNTAIGFQALFQTTVGSFNTAVGSNALTKSFGGNNTAVGFSALPNNVRGSRNTALGAEALFRNNSGNENTAVGCKALANNLADGNTAFGFQALRDNTTSIDNTAVGFNALVKNGGSGNTAVGSGAMEAEVAGSQNTALGQLALSANTTGRENTATGLNALAFNTTGSENTATGFASLSNNEGNDNTAVGHRAMELHDAGDNNTAVGHYALNGNGSDNTAIGQMALFNINRGDNNIALGNEAGKNLTNGDNNIFIGNRGARESNTIRIGTSGTQTASYVAGISSATVPDGVTVVVGADGHLGTVTSSIRYKQAIKPMDKASEAILALQPVTFRYKHELDPAGIPQFGLVAEQVEKVNPDLVARDQEGEPYTVRYEAVNAMLLNEFLKTHRKMEEQTSINQEQQATIAELKLQLHAVTDMLKAQALQLQKVTTQLAVDKPAPRVVADNL